VLKSVVKQKHVDRAFRFDTPAFSVAIHSTKSGSDLKVHLRGFRFVILPQSRGSRG
jgi:hypothetical protein